MEETYFGLKQSPFRSGLRAGCYYPATSHEQALAEVIRALRDDEGLVLLTGDSGTGKTLLAHRLIHALGAETSTAFVTHCHVTNRAELFQAILFDLDKPYEGLGDQELRLSLTQFLLDHYRSGRATVIFVDEAHDLSSSVLEELRFLVSLEGEAGPAVQVVLLAQPRIDETLKLPELDGFCQRLTVRVRLEPLGMHEAADYVLHRLRAAGGRAERLITDEALEMLARATHGIPRRLNQVAHSAFRIASAGAASSVDVEAIIEALTLLGLDVPDASEPPADERGSLMATNGYADKAHPAPHFAPSRPPLSSENTPKPKTRRPA